MTDFASFCAFFMLFENSDGIFWVLVLLAWVDHWQILSMLLDRFFLYTHTDVLNRYKQVMFLVVYMFDQILLACFIISYALQSLTLYLLFVFWILMYWLLVYLDPLNGGCNAWEIILR